MDQLLNHLDFWLMIVTIVAGIYYLVWKDRLEPLLQRLAGMLQGVVRRDVDQSDRRARPRPRSFQRRNVVTTKLQPRNEPFTASEKEVTAPLPLTPLRNNVTELEPLSTTEAAIIAVKLSQGISPSNVAKSLPGYTPSRYKEFAAKVQTVKAALAAAEAAELTYQPLTEDGAA